MRFRYGTPTIWRSGLLDEWRELGAASVAPRIVELDYVLGWALRGIASTSLWPIS